MYSTADVLEVLKSVQGNVPATNLIHDLMNERDELEGVVVVLANSRNRLLLERK